MKHTSKLVNIGALWLFTRRDGTESFKGNVTIDSKTVDIVMLYNGQKVSPTDQRPHFVLLSPEVEEPTDLDKVTEHPF